MSRARHVGRGGRRDRPAGANGPQERSGGLWHAPDRYVEDSHLGEAMPSARELSPNLVQGGAVAIELAFVAADERGRALAERRRRAWPRIVPCEVCLDDAVEHRNQRRALRVQGLCHLREADSADVGKAVEELRQRDPRDRARCVRQGRIGVDFMQGTFDLHPTLQNRCGLGRRDAGTAPVRPLEVALGERCRP